MASPQREILAVDNDKNSEAGARASAIAGAAKPPDDGHVHFKGENALAVDSGEWGKEGEEVEVPISATASVSSSLYEHVEENGRTYHKYKEGKYYLPNDELEQHRLDLQHHLCKFALHGRLHLAPLKEENLKNALDFGTGTGIWAIEFAEKYPNCQIIGSDLSPIQPEFVPQNLSFEVDDAEDTWIYPTPFTYIHGRLLAFAFTNPLSIFTKAFSSLTPGGYFEMQDLCTPIRSIDDSLQGTAMIRCSNLIVGACEKRGIDLTVPGRYKGMMEEVGFVDVREVVFEWPIGTWAKSPYHKRIGALFKHDMEVGVEGICMGLFTRVLGMTKEEVSVIVEDVKRDMNDKRIHSYQPFYVVYGRKPE